MLDYMRDDIKALREGQKEFREEHRDDNRRLIEALTKHTDEDHRNFKSIDERLGAIEVAQKTTSATKDQRFSRFVGYGSLAIAAIASITAVVALLK